MRGATHAFVGAAAGVAIAPDQPLVWLAGLVGGLLPDIDHAQSIINKFFPPGLIVALMLSHRGITHTALATGGVLLAGTKLLPEPVAVALAASYSLHLMCDMTTVQGVPLLYPIRYNLRLLPRWIAATFGVWFEIAVLVVSLLVMLYVWNVIRFNL